MYRLAAETNLFTALGLNWKTFILNTLAFFVVVWILKKFVYPSLMKALDAKIGDMTSAERLKAEAQAELDKAAEEAKKLIKEARAASDDILATTKSEASGIVDDARMKAEAQADRLIAESREQLTRDIESARTELKRDMAKLVTAATGAVIEAKLDTKADKELVEKSLVAK